MLNPPANEGQEQTPISCIRWKPNKIGQTVRASLVICALTSNGIILHWHLATNKLISESTYHRDNGNNLYCADYTCDGRKLVVGGSDRNLYVYDETNRSLEAILNSRDEKICGHQNRIFSVKCHPTNPNIFCSAGWDQALKIYDIKQGCPIASIKGPEIANDSLDIFDDVIVTGSNRNHDVMQLYSVS